MPLIQANDIGGRNARSKRSGDDRARASSYYQIKDLGEVLVCLLGQQRQEVRRVDTPRASSVYGEDLEH